MRFIEYYLSHEGEWLRSAERVVAIARVDFELRVEIRGVSEAADRYLYKLLAAHPFDEKSVRRWAVYRRGEMFGLFVARNRFEVAQLAAAEGAQPLELEVRAEDELDPAAWQALLDQGLSGG